MGKGWNQSENPKFDTNLMKPCRFREMQQTTTKCYAKLPQEEGLGMMKYGPWQPCMQCAVLWNAMKCQTISS